MKFDVEGGNGRFWLAMHIFCIFWKPWNDWFLWTLFDWWKNGFSINDFDDDDAHGWIKELLPWIIGEITEIGCKNTCKQKINKRKKKIEN